VRSAGAAGLSCNRPVVARSAIGAQRRPVGRVLPSGDGKWRDPPEGRRKSGRSRDPPASAGKTAQIEPQDAFSAGMILIHLKNSSTCHRLLYNAVIVNGGSAVLFVKNTSVFSNSWSLHAAFGARDEERARLMHLVQPGVIRIAAIHHIESTCLDRHEIQDVSVAHFAVAHAKIQLHRRVWWQRP
jgi:hypothetical protein